MAKQVETTYGNALLELALEGNKLDSLYEEAQVLVEILQANEDLMKILCHPQIDKDEKKTIIENTFSGKLSGDLTGLMVLLVTKGHSKEMVKVLRYFIAQVKKEKNIGVASVISAIELSASQKDAITKRLVETTSYDAVEVEFEVDKRLIGGLVIRIEDRVVDSSIKTKIEALSKTLAS